MTAHRSSRRPSARPSLQALRALLLGGGLLASGAALADELLVFLATDAEEHYQLLQPTAGAPLLGDVGVTLRLSAALATADGTDLVLLGQDTGTGQPYLWRIGRTATGPAALHGFSASSTQFMRERVLLSGPAVPPKAAWVGTEQRHIAVAGGEMRVRFYEPLYRPVSGVLAPQTPPGWPASEVSLPTQARLIAAGGPTRLYVSDAASNQVLRLEAGADPVPCSVSGGSTVTALAGLPDGRAVAALQNGRLAILPADCAGPVDPATDPQPFAFTALDALGSAPVYLGASGNNGVLRVYEVSGASITNQRSQVVDVAGAVAMGLLAGQPHVIVGGPDLYPFGDGYRLRRVEASGLGVVMDGAGLARQVLRMPDAHFGLSSRTVELDSLPGNQRVSLVRLYGAAGKALRLHAGTCQRTSVLQATIGMGGQAMLGAPILMAGTASAAYMAPANEALLAVAQAAQGEDCQLLLTGDAAAGRGGGAVLRVRGSTLGDRAFALVLDRSGSMFARVDPSAASGPGSEVRVDALRNAVGLFIDTVVQLPDASQARFALIPFNQQSSAGALPAMGFANGTIDQLRMPYMESILSPGGTTNIRGALKSAADRLAAQPGLSERSILLLTDGLHNVVGSPETNSPMVVPDDVNNLEPPAPMAGSTSAYLTGAGPGGVRRVDRLYAVGLSPMAVHPSLVNLVRHVNAPSSLEPIPPGYLDYSLRGNEVAQFFSKVLWGYLGATEFLDPLVQVNDGQPYRQEIRLSRNDRELIVAVSWLDPRRDVVVDLSHVGLDGMTAPVVRACNRRVRQGAGGYATCYVDPVQIKSSGQFFLELRKGGESDPGPVEAMVEVAGRSSVRLRTSFGKLVNRTGDRLHLLASLTELGLPIPAGAGKVTGTLSLPTAALGTVLAGLRVSGQQVEELRRKDPDLYPSTAAAKFALLPREQVPGRSERAIELFDDGQHGDGQAGDGVYGLEIEAPVPGVYRVGLRGTYSTTISGQGFREGSLATQVLVGIDGQKSLVRWDGYTPATRERPGSFRVVLRPQDAAGNLLGPGNAGDLLFRQGLRTLPAQVTETPELDGTYVAEVSDVRAEGPVLLVGSGGGYALLPDPTCALDNQACNRPARPGECTGGCCCRVGGAGARPSAAPPGPQGPGAALLLGLVGLGLLLRRRRR